MYSHESPDCYKNRLLKRVMKEEREIMRGGCEDESDTESYGKDKKLIEEKYNFDSKSKSKMVSFLEIEKSMRDILNLSHKMENSMSKIGLKPNSLED
jgi:hypothetical protein